MSDNEYNKLLDDLQEYVPYLENLIGGLKKQNAQNKGPQLEKFQKLYLVLTDKSKKYTLLTLKRCADVLQKMHMPKKHDNASSDCRTSTSKPFPKRKLSDNDKTCAITPKSPSPIREAPSTIEPIVIPTETVYKELYEPSELDINIPMSPSDDRFATRSEERYNEERPNIYETVAESLSPTKKKDVPPPIALTVPVISKPPLTVTDLELLTTELDKNAAKEEEEKERRRKRRQERKRTNIKTSTPNRRPTVTEEDDETANESTVEDRDETQMPRRRSDEGRVSSVDGKEKRNEKRPTETATAARTKESTADVQQQQQQKIYRRLADKYNPKPKPRNRQEEAGPPVDPITSPSDKIMYPSASVLRNKSGAAKGLPSHMTLDRKTPSNLTSAYDRILPEPSSPPSPNDKTNNHSWSPPAVSTFNPITTPHYKVPLYDGGKRFASNLQSMNGDYSNPDSINPYDDPRPAFPDDHMDSRYLNNGFSYDDFRKQDAAMYYANNQSYAVENARVPPQHPPLPNNVEERPRDPRLCRDGYDNNRPLPTPAVAPPVPYPSYPNNYFNGHVQTGYHQPAAVRPSLNPDIYSNHHVVPLCDNNNVGHVPVQSLQSNANRRIDPRTANCVDAARNVNPVRNAPYHNVPLPVPPPQVAPVQAKPNHAKPVLSKPLQSVNKPNTVNIKPKQPSNNEPARPKNAQNDAKTTKLPKVSDKQQVKKPVANDKSAKPIAKQPQNDAVAAKKQTLKSIKPLSDKLNKKLMRPPATSVAKSTRSDVKSFKSNVKSGKSDAKMVKSGTKSVNKSRDTSKTVYDQVYSKINVSEQFASPLESLYSPDAKSSSRGYGIQKFKIPKKPKPVEEPKPSAESWDTESMWTTETQPIEERQQGEVESNAEYEEECWDIEVATNVTESNEDASDVQENVEETEKEEEPIKRKDKKNNKRIKRKIRPLSSDEEESTKEDDGDKRDSVDGKKGDNDSEIITTSSDTLKKGLKGLNDGTINKSDFIQIVNSILGAQQTKKLEKIKRILHSDESSEDDDETNNVACVGAGKQKTEVEKHFDETMKQLKRMRSDKRNEAKEKKDDVVEAKKPRSVRRTELDILHADIKEVMGESMLRTSTKRNCTIAKTTNEPKETETADDGNNAVAASEASRTLRSRSSRVERPPKGDEEKETQKRTKRKTRLSKRLISESDTDLSPDEDAAEKETKKVAETKLRRSGRTSRNSRLDEKSDDETSEISSVNDSPSIKRGRATRSRTAKKIDDTMSESTPSDVTNDDKQSEKTTVDETTEKESAVKQKSKIVDDERLKQLHTTDYYYQPAVKMKCKLCQHKNFSLAAHYVTVHNGCEVLISRIDPITTKQAIDEAREMNLDAEEPVDMLTNSKRKHFSFSCLFCSLNFHKEFTENFYNHLTSHTGEFRNRCDHCNYASSSLKNLKLHVVHKHKTKVPEAEPPPLNYKYVFGYVCSACYYVQLHRENTVEHVNKCHADEKVSIVRISMSAFKEAVIEPDVPPTSEQEEPATTDEPKETVPSPPQSPLQKSVFMCEETDLSFDDNDNKMDDVQLQKIIDMNEGLRTSRTSIAEAIKTKLDISNDNANEILTVEDDDDEEAADASDMEIDRECLVVESKIITSELKGTGDEGIPNFNIKFEMLDKPGEETLKAIGGPLPATATPETANVCVETKPKTVQPAVDLPIKTSSSPKEQKVSTATIAVTMTEPKPCDGVAKTINKMIRTESMVIHVKKDSVIYTCLMTDCDYFCEDSVSFAAHCGKHEERVSPVCNVCNVKFEHEGSKATVTELFAHLKLCHLDGETKEKKTGNDAAPLVAAKQEIASPVVAKIKTEPLFTKSDSFPMNIQITSVESQGKQVYGLSNPAVTSERVPATPPVAVPAPAQRTSSPMTQNVPIGIDKKPVQTIPLKQLVPKSPDASEPKKSAPTTTATTSPKNKSDAAMKLLLQWPHISHLYKCVVFECEFSTKDKSEFERHLTNNHPQQKDKMHGCLYCKKKILLADVPDHYHGVHANSGHNCVYCFYRAVNIAYVKAHIKAIHPKHVIDVLEMSTNDDAPNDKKRTSPPIALPAVRHLPLYECGENECDAKYFAIEEYRDHLASELESRVVIKCFKCKECFMRVNTLLQHLHERHAFNTFVCGLCPSCDGGCDTLKGAFLHIVHSHPDDEPFIVLRKTKVGAGDYPVTSVDAIIENSYVYPRDFDTDGDLDLSSSLQMNVTPEYNQMKAIASDALEKLLKPHNKDNNFVDGLLKNMVEHLQTEQPSQNDDGKSSEETERYDDQQQRATQEMTDVFRCAVCTELLPDATTFRNHSTLCYPSTSKETIRCYHCKRTFKALSSLFDHMNNHAPPRFQCSICMAKKPLPQLRFHMRKMHKVISTVMVPIDPYKLDASSDHFILRPAQEETQPKPPIVDKGAAQEMPVKWKYNPSDVEQLPRSAIFPRDIYCGLCMYASKVRMNLVRHFQFHDQQNTAVPTSAPINPVPCLEKNEKMFDKMTNLASSSHPVGRMSTGASTKKPPAVNDDVPVFVPETKRYVCGAENCDYLCLGESMLRRHLQALHADDQEYNCQHCSMKLCTDKLFANLDNVMKHYRLHEATLFKCPHCKFLHNLKHKMERHVGDKHPDQGPHYITVRECVKQNLNAKDTSKEQQVKQWKCGLCKTKRSSKDDIVSHVAQMHNISAQYKCAFCNYLTEDTGTFKAHFDKLHPGRDIDIITAYYKEEDVYKAQVPRGNFDTTPIWFRDKPRVKHIRGILLEDSGKIPKKNPMKISPELTLQKTREDQLQLQQSAASESLKTDSTVQKPKMDKKPPKLSRQSSSETTKKETNENDNDGVVNGTEPLPSNKRPRKKPPRLERNIDLDTSVIEIIDDEDDEDANMPPVKKQKTEGRTMPPLIPIKPVPDRSKEPPRPPAVQRNPVGTIELPYSDDDFEDIDDEEDDVNGEMGIFGPYGAPLDSNYFCPLCNVMKTTVVEDFVKHLYEELEYTRYSCALCQKALISYKTMVEHITKTHGEFKEGHVISMPANVQIECWVRKVVDVQKKLIEEYEKEPLLVPYKTTSIDLPTNGGQPPAKKSKTDAGRTCTICNISFSYPSRLKEHMKKHKFTTPNSNNNNKATIKSLYDTRIPRLSLDKSALKCKYCETYGTYQALKIHHVDSHEGLIFVAHKYSCKSCDTYYTKLGDVKEHMTKRHYKCDKYESIFSGATKDYKCDTCGNEYKNVLFLKLHISNKMRCVNARILRRESDKSEFVDALQSDFVTYISMTPTILQTSIAATARKSTTMTKNYVKNNDVNNKNDDLSRITLSGDIDGKERLLSVREFAKMRNIYPRVLIEDFKMRNTGGKSMLTNLVESCPSSSSSLLSGKINLQI